MYGVIYMKKILYVLGIRPVHYFEVLMSVLGFIGYFVAYYFIGWKAVVIPGVFYGVTILYNVIRFLKRKDISIDFPVISVILSIILASFNMVFLPITVLLIWYCEDFVEYIRTETVVIKQGARLLIEPLRRKESLTVFLGILIPGIIFFIYTSNPVALLPSAVAYLLMLYSMIYYMPTEVSTPGESILEKLGNAIPLIRVIFSRIYQSERVLKLMKEAGTLGAEFDIMLEKIAGIFTILIILSIALSGYLYIATLNPIVPFVPVAVSFMVFFTPLLILYIKRNSRKSKLANNLVISLSYFLTSISVGLDILQSFNLLEEKLGLAKLFGLDLETKIFKMIKTVHRKGDPVEEYGANIPEKRFRDAILGAHTNINIQGIRTARRRLWEVLSSVLSDLVRTTENKFNMLGGVMQVSMLLLVIAPALSFGNTGQIPLMILLGGFIMFVMLTMSAIMTYPNLPSEYPNAKRRLKYGAMLVPIVAVPLGIATIYIIPEYKVIDIILATVLGILAAAWYAVSYDYKLNNMYFEYGADMIRQFALELDRTNSVVQALRTMARNIAFPGLLRTRLKQHATRAEVTADVIVMRGGFWEKYFSFIVWMSQRFGRVPFELTQFMSTLMVRMGDIITSIRNHAKLLMFLALLILGVTNLEIQLFASMQAPSVPTTSVNLGGITSFGNFMQPLSSQALAFTAVVLEVAAILMGIGISKAHGNTMLDAKYPILFYIAQLIMYAVLIKYHLINIITAT